MSVRKSVFGSDRERRNYAKLRRTWASTHNVYHNIPFLNIIAARGELLDERGRTFRVSDAEYDKLKRASVDYVICTLADEPVVAIEFDGLGACPVIDRRDGRADRQPSCKRRGRRVGA